MRKSQRIVSLLIPSPLDGEGQGEEHEGEKRSNLRRGGKQALLGQKGSLWKLQAPKKLALLENKSEEPESGEVDFNQRFGGIKKFLKGEIN